jgi:hypothetical protein
MPMVGHIAEFGVVIGHEFHEGTAAPAVESKDALWDKFYMVRHNDRDDPSSDTT